MPVEICHIHIHTRYKTFYQILIFEFDLPVFRIHVVSISIIIGFAHFRRLSKNLDSDYHTNILGCIKYNLLVHNSININFEHVS